MTVLWKYVKYRAQILLGDICLLLSLAAYRVGLISLHEKLMEYPILLYINPSFPYWNRTLERSAFNESIRLIDPDKFTARVINFMEEKRRGKWPT